MNIDWLPIFLSALASGLLSLAISHAYYRISVRSAAVHHRDQMHAAQLRHAEQMKKMEKQHAEQVLVLRTALLAIEKQSGVEAARDPEGNLTGGVHHEGQFTAVPGVSRHAIKATAIAGDHSAPDEEAIRSPGKSAAAQRDGDSK
jgi:hypothetical protein